MQCSFKKSIDLHELQIHGWKFGEWVHLSLLPQTRRTSIELGKNRRNDAYTRINRMSSVVSNVEVVPCARLRSRCFYLLISHLTSTLLFQWQTIIQGLAPFTLLNFHLGQKFLLIVTAYKRELLVSIMDDPEQHQFIRRNKEIGKNSLRSIKKLAIVSKVFLFPEVFSFSHRTERITKLFLPWKSWNMLQMFNYFPVHH